MIINGLLEVSAGGSAQSVSSLRIDKARSAAAKLQLYGMTLGGATLDIYLVIGGAPVLVFTTTSNNSTEIPVYGNCDQIRIAAPAGATLSYSYVSPEE
jgi:hypothetical protein